MAEERHEIAFAMPNGVSVGVYPSGKKSGGGRGMYYRFKVLCRGFVLMISEHSRPIEQTPNVLVEMGSTLLMSTRGLPLAWAELKNTLECLGGYVFWSKVSRMDVCADLPGVNVAELVNLVLAKQRVCRARSLTYFEEEEYWRGIQLGTGQVVLRMYDKAFEVYRKKQDSVKQHLLLAHRWGGPQDTALRVEFQVRREALKGAGIDGVGDYFRKRKDLVAYLVNDWFRLTAVRPDKANNNTQRAETHPQWLEIVKAFEAWAGASTEPLRRDRRRTQRDPIRLVKQAFGCLLGAVSDLKDGNELTPEEFIILAEECLEWNLGHMSIGEFVQRYQDKALPRQLDGQADEPPMVH